MNLLKSLFCFAILSSVYTVNAQDYEFGKVTMAEVESMSDTAFPDANAVVLFRDVNSYLGNYVEVYERIKIYNEEGYEHATISIPYPDVSKLKGATYNMVNGELVKTELDKDMVFTEEVIKGVDIKKFSFPNVSPGSVLELSYRSTKGTLSDIDLQYDIPIKRIVVKITNRSQSATEILQNPRAFLNVNRNENGGTTLITASNVEALESENYVYDMDMYRSYLKINLISITDSYRFGNWKTLAGAILDINSFTYAFKPKSVYKDKLAELVGSETDKRKQIQQVYNFLREEIKWDDTYGILPDQSIKDVFKKREGSMADINAMFISMLRELDMDANPVLVSTKLNGIPLTASLSAFNGLIAGVVLDGKIELFDVVGDRSGFELLDTSLLNWKGMYLNTKEKTFTWVQLSESEISQKSVFANMSIDDEMLISGKARERNAGYYAATKKQQLKDLSKNEVKNILNYDMAGLELIDVVATNRATVTDVEYDFELENAIDEIDDKLYLSPLFFYAVSENPFQKDERKYPIDFGFKFKRQVMINLKIPENYKVESLPEASRILIPDDIGSFVYLISETNGVLQVSTTFEINETILPYDKYAIIKEFFKVRIEKEQEKVVLSKI